MRMRVVHGVVLRVVVRALRLTEHGLCRAKWGGGSRTVGVVAEVLGRVVAGVVVRVVGAVEVAVGR